MRFRCPFCYFITNTDESSRGYTVRCSGCGKEIRIPAGKFEPGCVIGDFVIDEKIGSGSIGTIYRSTQLSLNREAALKILSADCMTERGTAEFLKEARLAANLSHPNLVQAYAAGEDQGVFYFAMNCIRGETLKTRLRREGRIPVDEALHIIQQVAEALCYAWEEAGLIHRDVKPDNIMLAEDGVVKLTDLGLALRKKDIGEKTDVSGSPNYMSPEQFRGEKLDSRSDIYSLGITLYQLITGRLPFLSEDIRGLAKKHLYEEPESLRHFLPSLPQEVENLVMKMIRKEAGERFSSFEDLLKTVWTIRQKTAPNRSLIPDVHTLSMKRLDYEMQNETAVWKEKAQYQREAGRNAFGKLLYFTAGAVSALLAAGGIYFLFHTEKSAAKTLRPSREVLVYQKIARDTALTPDSRMHHGLSLLQKYTEDSTPEAVYSRGLIENEVFRLKSELAGEEHSRSMRKVRSLQVLNANLTREKKSLSRKASHADDLEKKLTSSRTDQKNLLRLYLYDLQRNGRFDEAEVLLLSRKDSFAGDPLFLKKKTAENRMLRTSRSKASADYLKGLYTQNSISSPEFLAVLRLYHEEQLARIRMLAVSDTYQAVKAAEGLLKSISDEKEKKRITSLLEKELKVSILK